MRIYFLEKFFLAGLLFLGLILWYYQIIKGPYFQRLSDNNRIRIVPIMPDRGDLLDREGRKIASEIPSFDLALIPQELKDTELVLEELSRMLDISLDETKRIYRKNILSPFAPVTIARNIPLEKIALIEEQKPDLAGVDLEINSRRFYPFGATAANLIGYLSEINTAELERLKPYGYRIKSLVGKSGLEKSLDVYLRGEPGGRQVEVDNRGNMVGVLGEKKAIAGKEIELTINMEWQNKAHQLITAHKGAILIMDPRDGQILVLESSPSFDPNLFVLGDIKKLRPILNSPKSPLLNRALKANFSPGSIFKLVVAIAGLETKKINPHSQFRCDGKLYLGKEEFKCWEEKGHGNQTLVDAIKHSCNIFFYKLGSELGYENIRNFAKILGLSENSGIGLQEESKGLIPNASWKYSVHREKWFEGDTLNLAIGQGFVLVSPIQILRLVAAIGNGGFLVKPYLVKNIAGTPVQEIKREFTGIKEENLNIVKEGMLRVVNNPDGTGNRARIEGLDIAAKTATVQTSKGTTHAWIAGFLPYQNPKLAFVVFLEHGGRGGVEAADICHALFSELKQDILNYK